MVLFYVVQYTHQVIHLLFDNTCYKSISKAGQLFVQQAYSWDTMNQKLIDLIEKA